MKLSNLVSKVISLLSISFISGGGISLIIGLTEKSQRNKNLSKFKKNDVEKNKQFGENSYSSISSSKEIEKEKLKDFKDNYVKDKDELSIKINEEKKEVILEKNSSKKVALNSQPKKITPVQNETQRRRISKRKIDSPKELIGREKWNQERKEQKVQLESIYRYSEDGYFEANKSGCILYRDGDRISEETDIVEGTEKEDMRDPCDWRTNWSLERYKEGKKGGFWIRGKKIILITYLNSKTIEVI